MYFHIGNRKITSKEKIIGIFPADINTEKENIISRDEYITAKSVIVNADNSFVYSIVTSTTLIDRFNGIQYDDCLFRRSIK